MAKPVPSGLLRALRDANRRWSRALCTRVGSFLSAGPFGRGVPEGEADHAGSLFGGPARAGAAGLRARRAKPGRGRRHVRGRRDHGLPLAAGVACRGATRGKAARRRPGASAGRGGAGRAQGRGGREQRSDLGRVRGQARGPRRGAGERIDRVPGAQEARPAAQKRRCWRGSRIDPMSPRLGRPGVPSWPRSTHGGWSSSTRAASTPA